MAHLKSKSERRWAKHQKVFQQRLVELKGRRELYQDRPQMIPFLEHTGYFQEALQRALAASQPLDVRNLLVSFQRETKPFPHAFRPVQQQILRRHAIEAVIDLHRRELRGVVAEHFLVGQLLGIEIPFPLFIGISRSPHAKLAGWRYKAPLRQSI